MILTLCGSAKFEPAFHAWNEVLGLRGHSVFGLCVYPSQKAGEKTWYTPEEKKILDEVHFDKIAASHGIVLLNYGGYIGESTGNEIWYAQARNKPVYAVTRHRDVMLGIGYVMLGIGYAYDLLGRDEEKRKRDIDKLLKAEALF